LEISTIHWYVVNSFIHVYLRDHPIGKLRTFGWQHRIVPHFSNRDVCIAKNRLEQRINLIVGDVFPRSSSNIGMGEVSHFKMNNAFQRAQCENNE
jgi:hypothetical protein